MKKLLPLACIFIVVFLFFWPFFSKSLLPIPADDIVGLYHPFRDLYAKSFPRGIPYKNYLITDPIRQQYPWRELAISIEKKLQLPLWNPYSLSGTPLLANFQSASLYPFNTLFILFPLPIGWSVLILLQPLLAALFLYFYLDNLKLSKWASLTGGLAFAFCGFFISWLEWGTVVNAGLWLPLAFLSIDKLVFSLQPKTKKKNILGWAAILTFSLTSSFLAGHLQTAFYVIALSICYATMQWIRYGKSKKLLAIFITCIIVFGCIIAIQLLPTFGFIQLSARDLDQANWKQNPGWFIPMSHLVQFIAPDFFGNPATLNYWSIFNYGEFIGYIGIFPLIMAFLAICFRRDKKTLFFTLLSFLSFLFSFPTLISKLPFLLHIPFLSTSQPTRLMFITDFSLAVLSALGFDYYLRNKRKILLPILFIFCGFCVLWIIATLGKHGFLGISAVNLAVAKRNLYLPTIIFAATCFLAFFNAWTKKKYLEHVVLVGFIIVTAFDLLRFGLKYDPFIQRDFLFPKTKTLSFLHQQQGQFRIMTSDSPVFPPNFSVVFRLQSVDGYDPLYLRRYAELIAAAERGQPDITPPFGFNRIITPHNFDSKIADFLGIKYILSRTVIASQKLSKVFQEGKTRVYENPLAFPRVFFVQETRCLSEKKQIIEEMFKDETNLHKTAFLETIDSCMQLQTSWSNGKANISSYSENNVTIETENKHKGFLVFVDSYYPTWHAKVYRQGENLATEAKIYLTDFNFRGVIVPPGKHTIQFYMTLL